MRMTAANYLANLPPKLRKKNILIPKPGFTSHVMNGSASGNLLRHLFTRAVRRQLLVSAPRFLCKPGFHEPRKERKRKRKPRALSFYSGRKAPTLGFGSAVLR